MAELENDIKEKPYDYVGEFLKFECKNCSKSKYVFCGKYECHDDGKLREGTYTCPYWREKT